MVLDSWYQPSGASMGWLNLKHMLLLSFLTFKFLHWSSYYLPLWNWISYVLILMSCYWFGFVFYRWLKRNHLALSVASYKKAVFITGCDDGLGNMLARKLAPRGFQVFAGCLDSESAQAKHLNSIPNIKVVAVDVTNEQTLKSAVDNVQQSIQQADNTLWAVVCNAGICEVGEVEWQATDKLQKMLDVNVFGTIRTVKAFLPMLRQSKGRIVLTSSAFSVNSCPGFVGYSMTESAIASLGEGLKRELDVWDVDVCTVQPALYNTGMIRVNDKKNQFLNEGFGKLPDQMKKDYGHDYYVGFWNALNQFVKDNSNQQPHEAVNMLYKAITTVWPETHYRVGSWRQMLFYNLLDFMPTEVADICFDLLMKNPIEPEGVLLPVN